MIAIVVGGGGGGYLDPHWQVSTQRSQKEVSSPEECEARDANRMNLKAFTQTSEPALKANDQQNAPYTSNPQPLKPRTPKCDMPSPCDPWPLESIQYQTWVSVPSFKFKVGVCVCAYVCVYTYIYIYIYIYSLLKG